MAAKLRGPEVDLASLVLRWVLAAIFIVHGLIKVVVGTKMFDELTVQQQHLVGWTELVAGSLLALGLLSRIASPVLIFLQAGAIWMYTGSLALKGPMPTITGTDYTKVGPEYNVALIGMALCVALLGSGVFSLDYLLARWWRSGKAPQPAPEKAGAAAAVAPGERLGA
jgi:uncharacterized membrane protein YphA (DoxX/SURF4 family)